MSSALAKSTGTALRGRSDDIEFQFALFDKFNLARTMAKNYLFVPTDDEKHPWKLAKRTTPVSIYDDGSHVSAVSQVQKTYSERVGFSRARGKYNDEGRLITNEALSIKVGEVAAWATI